MLTQFQQPTLDVEAAVRDGRLDFGLFGPDSRLDSATADRIIAEVRQEISALVDTPGPAVQIEGDEREH